MAGSRWMRFALPLCLGGCLAPPVETPVTTVVQETDVHVEQTVKNKVDILFLVDDSPSMMPKQAALQARFPDLIKVLDDFGAKGNPAWYHIGVVTSDLGSAQSTACPDIGGTGAKLQPLGKAHGATCQAPGNGLNFIDYNQLDNTNNLPAGQDLPTTFTCMASVGDTGCGFEHQLEAPYRALKNCMPAADGTYPNCTIPQNQGFLRYDSILVVVFLTDEDDDCSAPDDTDLFDANKVNAYGALDSYRGTQYGVMCNYMGMDQLMPYGDSGGPLMNCHAAPNPATITADTGNSSGLPPAGQGKCFDVNRYINFYTHDLASGGVRVDPNDVILAAIDAPSTPVQSFLGNPTNYQPCSMLGTNCAVLLQHSCNASAEFFGDPAVRINQVVSAAKNNNITSICAMDYTAALTTLGQQIVSHIGKACLSSPITDTANPDCVVQDRLSADNSVADSIESCASTNNVQPCWEFVTDTMCPPVVNPADCSVTQGSISIQRDMTTIPPGTYASVACATLAHSSTAANCTNPSPSP